MAVRPLNSIAGFSTGDPAVTIVQANGDITTINFTANGVSNLGPVSNVTITGGTSGQVISTDGNGVLSFTTVNAESNRAAPMPYQIDTGDSYIVNENFQGLYSNPITIDGELVVDGMLIEINDSVQANNNQVLYASTTGVATGNAGFEFQYWDGNLNVPGNINVTGSVIPSANDTYDLGSANYRFANAYFGGNTLYVGNASISVDGNGFIVLTNEVGGSFTVEGTQAAATNEIENGNSRVTVAANGNVSFTVAGTSNVLVVTTAGANLTGNLTAGGVKTDNLYYANGTAWDLGGNPGGSNTQVQFNSAGEFGASANFVFDTATNNLTITGNVVTNTGALYGNAAGLTSIPGANVTGTVANATHSSTANTIVDAAQPNITSVGTLTDLSVSGNGTIGGNLVVNGNLVYVNVEELSIEDPIINLNTGANGAPPASNSGKDVGSALNYYDTQARIAFMGWDTSNAEFAFGSQTSISSEVVTFTTLGNVRAQTFKGNIEATTISGNLTTATQANITTVGTLGSLSVTGNVTPGNVSGANTVSANYLVSNTGCVSVGGAFLAYDSGTGSAGIFSSGPSNINLGLSANITLGSTTSTSNIRGELTVGANATITGNISANLVTGTLTTSAQPNITSVGTLTSLTISGNVSGNNATANTVTTNSVISKRSNVAVTTQTVIDSFDANTYRVAKYTIRGSGDLGYEALEVLLVHDNINSYVTVYGAINTGGSNVVSVSSRVTSGNIEVIATGLGANTVVNMIGTYVPD